MYVCRVIWVNNKLLAGRKCDISVCTADIFKHRDYLVRWKNVLLLRDYLVITRPDYTFSRRATFSPDAFIILVLVNANKFKNLGISRHSSLSLI